MCDVRSNTARRAELKNTDNVMTLALSIIVWQDTAVRCWSGVGAFTKEGVNGPLLLLDEQTGQSLQQHQSVSYVTHRVYRCCRLIEYDLGDSVVFKKRKKRE